MSDNDTIVAQATTSGRGGIGIVRMSGPLVDQICRNMIGRLPQPRLATLCDFVDAEGGVIDQGIALYFTAPQSYTGEPVLELQGHGSPIVARMLIARCVELGARMARPGEFTERAFLNGKLDLAQAEAVADLIESSTESAARSAQNALQGVFSDEVHLLANSVTALRIYVEAAIDFPDEEIDFLADRQVTDRLESLWQQFDDLRRSMYQGKLLRDGLKVVLTGAPNVGKSSLLNLLSREQRAIVSHTPGTTRDTLEQHIDLDGLPLVLIDTAGIRQSDDAIEVEGVRRAHEARRSADVLLILHDLSQSHSKDDPATAEDDYLAENVAVVINVNNKIDLCAGVSEPSPDDRSSVNISALTGQGIERLKHMLKDVAGYQQTDSSQYIARQRHIDAIDRARGHLDQGIDQMKRYQAGEILAEELRLCHNAIGEITGEVGSDDLLGMIFSSFCIGK